jgi:hypothetical protein
MTKKRDIPIKTYSIDQTGPKIQSGGVKFGLSKYTYQPAIEGKVNSAPIVPTSWGRRIEKMSNGNSVFVNFNLIY